MRAAGAGLDRDEGTDVFGAEKHKLCFVLPDRARRGAESAYLAATQ